MTENTTATVTADDTAVVEKAVTRRGAAKTGNPQSDRKANEIKADKKASAPKLTKYGQALLTLIGNWSGSFFDGGITEDSGIYFSVLTDETAGADGMAKTKSGQANVITKLGEDGYLDISAEEAGEQWVSLTKLGAETALQLAATQKATPEAKAPAAEPKAEKAPAAEKAPTKKAPAAKKAPAPKAPKVKAPVELPKGYTVKYENGAYDLAKKGEGAPADGPGWYVICTAHGTTTTAAKAKDGDALGRKASRATWCKQCKAEAKA